MSAEARLAAKLVELKIEMPLTPEPKGVYKPLSIAGNLVYTSGHLPVDSSGKPVVGRLGADMDVPAGYNAAQLAGLGILASLKKQFGSLDKIQRLIKVFGAVNSAADFTQQPAVINGCSELFAEIFGNEFGIAARTAVGVGTLPLGVCVEIEAIFELKI
jgi:enamine deaminase RidA (YjgF/YER057c/UK114 family)